MYPIPAHPTTSKCASPNPTLKTADDRALWRQKGMGVVIWQFCFLPDDTEAVSVLGMSGPAEETLKPSCIHQP